ncbi:MAG: hypothetical protein GWO20_00385 [Candidatus Korarchaeota archaeon]|nr:hypothetical protein [Candidatus Korarchaeota archaeon]NIW12453.1 hypothetical protein [Candidatus Thorarchaeota archaeon]NIW50668.1 hypothetical protein [Candidatus Korarchaeota archaeon]
MVNFTLNKITTPTRFFGLFLSLASIEVFFSILSEGQITTASFAVSIVIAFLMSFVLAWLASLLHLTRIHMVAVFWINLFVVVYLNNMIEAYFFTDVFTSVSFFLSTLFVTFLFTGIEATVAGYFLTLEGEDKSLIQALREYFAQRTLFSWGLRIALASIVYFPIYFFFGALVSPFIIEYYQDSSLLKIPPFSVIIPLEIFRGFLYVLVLLLVIAVSKGEKRSTFFILLALLFIFGALIPLMSAPTLPPAIIPFHLVEILADSVVYGYALIRLLWQPRK